MTAAGAHEPVADGLDLFGRPLPHSARAPNAPLGHVPRSRPGSIRRTMSIDVDWPSALNGPARFQGRARDVLTLSGAAAPLIIGDAQICGSFASDRTILQIESVPPRDDVAKLAGERAGANLRTAIALALREERCGGTPLYLLLDDLAGASLVSRWGRSRRSVDVPQEPGAAEAPSIAAMEGVCIGFRPGSSALIRFPGDGKPNLAFVAPLPHPDDPMGWHEFPIHGEATNFRRARLIDLWIEDGILVTESVFQDSLSLSGTQMREALHEYGLRATADQFSDKLLTLKATPGTLPHPECPAATVNIDILLNSSMRDLREAVLDRLKRTAGCTHLNDMIRALAEVPSLAQALPRS